MYRITWTLKNGTVKTEEIKFKTRAMAKKQELESRGYVVSIERIW